MSVKTVITDGGFEMLRAAPNHTLVYTRAACGSGFVDSTQLALLNDVSDYVMDLSIVDVKPSATAATLRLQLDNSKAPREFQLYQIGVFAKLLDGETEIMGSRLLQIMQYDEPDIVRAIPHLSEYVVNTLMGQAETVEGVIDLAAYVSIRQFQDLSKNVSILYKLLGIIPLEENDLVNPFFRYMTIDAGSFTDDSSGTLVIDCGGFDTSSNPYPAIDVGDFNQEQFFTSRLMPTRTTSSFDCGTF